jgi:uncharacterized protein HemX
MRALHLLVIAVAIGAASPVFAQQQPSSAPAGTAENTAEKLRPERASESAKKEARKARREHRKMVHHRQRRTH